MKQLLEVFRVDNTFQRRMESEENSSSIVVVLVVVCIRRNKTYFVLAQFTEQTFRWNDID